MQFQFNLFGDAIKAHDDSLLKCKSARWFVVTVVLKSQLQKRVSSPCIRTLPVCSFQLIPGAVKPKTKNKKGGVEETKLILKQEVNIENIKILNFFKKGLANIQFWMSQNFLYLIAISAPDPITKLILAF